ncbi:MAG TPA: hypothetical protein VN922_13640 [Bacteroidia bacterium]|nr:hypothetical protein [Bacteroidia bacterium]
MKFAFYKAHNSVFDALIRWWENGTYSHVEAILEEFDDGVTFTIASSKPGIGIRTTTQILPASDWDIIEAPGDVESVTKWFKDRDGAKYDYLGILGMIIRPVEAETDRRYFCSEAVGESLGISEAWRFDPNGLYAILQALQVVSVNKQG